MASTQSSFYLWTLTLPWRTLIYDSANKCSAQDCGNKTANYASKKQDDRSNLSQGRKNKCLGSWHPSASALSAFGSRGLENLLFEQNLQTLHSCDMIIKKILKIPIETDIQLKGKHQSQHFGWHAGRQKLKHTQFTASPTATSATSSLASWC